MREKKGTLWLLVLAASCAISSLVFGVVAWWIFHDRPGTTTSDVIAIVGLAAAFGGAVGALFGQPLFAQWLAERRGPPGAAVTVLEDADLLAAATKDQWTRAAEQRGLLAPSPIPVRWKRSSLPVAGPVSSAVGSKQIPARFPPLPGLAATTPVRLRSGRLQDLHAVYGGLASGRLLIVGQPGAGKTSAAAVLLLAALAYREQVRAEDRPQVPVPVMLTLQGWDPGGERFEQWLIARLAETYPLFAGTRGAARARALLSAGGLAAILDGLDEIPTRLRAPVLRALSEQARVRVVLVTRSAEMAAAAIEAHLVDAAALELQPVDAGIAADYLTRVQIDPAPPGWRELIAELRDSPNGSIATALGSPLAISLLRDTYRTGDDVRELFEVAGRAANDEAARQEVENHLLDRVLPTAYGHRLGESPARYDLPTAERALRYLATRMNQDHSRDLRWWLVARWVPLAPRVVVSALMSGSVVGLGLALSRGLVIGLAVGIVWGLVAGLVFGVGGGQPEQRGALRVRRLLGLEGLLSGLAGGLVFALVMGVLFGPSYALVGGLVCGLGVWAWTGLSDAIAETASPLSPLDSWRTDRRFGLMSMLVFGLVLGLATVVGLQFDPLFGFVGGAVIGLVFGFMYSETWPARLAFLQLAAKRRTPARLIRFLEDARERGILRTVGPVYQFRHARLQDRLGTMT